MRPKPKPTTIRLDHALLASVDSVAAQMDMKRADLLRHCVRLGLAQVVREQMMLRALQSPATTTETAIGEPNVVALPPARVVGDHE